MMRLLSETRVDRAQVPPLSHGLQTVPPDQPQVSSSQPTQRRPAVGPGAGSGDPAPTVVGGFMMHLLPETRVDRACQQGNENRQSRQQQQTASRQVIADAIVQFHEDVL